MKPGIDLSIVIPVYNSAAIFPELYGRLVRSLEETGRSFEIIAVVDGCSDDSAQVIESHCQGDCRVRLVEFSRNFGHQAAVTAGLQYSCGEMVVIIDDDLEDPPEVIPRLLEEAEKGPDVIYGIRKGRKVSRVKKGAYYLFYRLINRMTEIDLPVDSGDFCLLKRRVVEHLKAMPERNRYVRGLRTWVGFKQIGVEYDRGKRHAGESGYNLRKYLRLALNAMFSFSYKPLQFFSYFGFGIALVGFALAIYLILKKLLGGGIEVAGWVSIMVAVLFLGGIQLMSIGVLGQYVARIYDEVKNRPAYVVKRTLGFEQRK